MIRLLADAHLSCHFVQACLQLAPGFPVVHIADWMEGRHRTSTDPVLLSLLREHGMVIVGFDRRTMAMHAGCLTREGLGHAGERIGYVKDQRRPGFPRTGRGRKPPKVRPTRGR